MSEKPARQVYELRVHGVSGTPPESMLSDPFPEQVAGDDVARFFRKTRSVEDGDERIVEAFHWGRFTSGSASRTLWLLLLPFALLNLSRYMLLDDRPAPKFVLRFLGLVLTSLLVSNVVYMSLELVVRQCSTSDTCRKNNSWLDFMKEWDFGWQLLLGMVPVVLVILLLWWFGRQTFLYGPKTAGYTPVPDGPMRNPAFWSNAPRTRVLRDLHVAAACATAGVMHGGMLNTGLTEYEVQWWFWLSALVVGGVLLFLAMKGVYLEPPPQTETPTTDPLQKPAAGLKWLSLGYLVVASGSAVWFLRKPGDRNQIDVPLAGFEFVTMFQTGLMGVLLLLLLLLSCYRPRNERRKVHRAFKPMWFGFGAFVVAAFAATLALGFSGGFAYRLADLLGKPIGSPVSKSNETIQLSAAYWSGVALWGWLAVAFLVTLLPLLASMIYRANAVWVLLPGAVCVVLSVLSKDRYLLFAGLALLVIGIVWGVIHVRGEKQDTLARKDYEGESDEGVVVSLDDKAEKPRAIDKIVTSWRIARTKYRYHWVLGTICVLGGGLVVAAGVYALLRWLRLVPDDMGEGQPVGLGGWVLSGLATGLVVIGIRSWQGQKMRTVVGVLWDLIAFWPRYAHPICPPPYGGRATLTLYERAKYLVSMDGKENIVVLSGHSQGSVVCVAAALLLDGDEQAPNKQLRLITYGSQLQWAFARLFPRYLGFDELKCVHTKLRGLWWNVHRWTDPLGGHVLVWPDAATTNHPLDAQDWHGFGALRYEPITATRWYERLGCEYRLRDPESVASRDDRPRSPLRGHSGYYLDPAFDALVEKLAATGVCVQPEFKSLNKAEQELVESARRGEVCSFPAGARPEIRASVLRDLLLSEPHPDGVRLENARVVGGSLDITGLFVPVGLWLEDCELDCVIVAPSAKVPWLKLVRCRVPGLSAEGIDVGDCLDLRGSTTTGPVRLSGAVIGGDLDLDGPHELRADGIRVGGAGPAELVTPPAGRPSRWHFLWTMFASG
jgi:hypothetical protein